MAHSRTRTMPSGRHPAHARVERETGPDQERLRAALELSGMGLYEWDLEGRRLFPCEQCARLLGCAPEDLDSTLESWVERIHPEDRERYRETVRQHFKPSGTPFALEYRVRRGDGSFPWFLDRGRYLPGEGGAPPRILGTLQNITSRKRAEELSSNIAQTLDLYRRSAPIAIIEWTPAFEVVDWNPAAERIFGYSRQEALGKRAVDLVQPPEQAERFQEATVQFLHESTSRHIFNENITKDGRRIQCEWFTTPLMDARGQVTGAASLAMDVSERRRAEEALRVSEARHRALVSAMPDILFLQDAQGVYLDFHAPEPALLQFPPEAFLGRSVKDIFPGGLGQRVLKAAQRAQRTGRVEVMEYSLGEGDGLRHYEARIVACDEDRFLSIVRDITTRRQSETRLHQAEAQYRALFEDANEGIFRAAPDGSYTIVNPALARMHGFASPEACLAAVRDHAWSSYARAEDLQDFLLAMEAPGFVRGFEYEAQRRDGGRIWLYQDARAIRDASGRITHLEGYLVDITARKLTEAALQASEARYRTVVENSGEGIAMSDADDNIIFANAAAEAILGTEPGALLGRNFKDFLAPEHQPHPRPLQEDTGTYDIKILRDDGQHRDLLLTATPHRDEQDRVIGAFGIFRDITERIRTREALRQSEERLRLIMDCVPLILSAVDREEVFTLSRGLGLELLGLKQDEQVGLSLDVVYRDHPEMVWALRRALAGETFRSAITHGDLTFESHFAPLRDSEGTIQGALCVSLDITEQKRTEELARRSQKMESLSLMAAGIAHDFNNLLQVISGHLELALLKRDPLSPPPPFLGEIQSAVTQATHLTAQMLQFSGGGLYSLRPLDLGKVVKDAVPLLRSLHTPMPVIECHVEEGLPPIGADRAQIRHLLKNLVTNATEAMEDRPGSIRISVTSCSLESDQAGEILANAPLRPGPYVVLAVADDGCGMDPETRSRVFEPFFSTKFTGRGLGLASVLGILQAHQAGYRISSEPGRGTRMSFFFPAENQIQAARRPVQETRQNQPEQRHILVVDDDREIRLTTCEMLQFMGHAVMEAKDGLEALEVFKANLDKIGLLIMDLTMPRMDGREALLAIRALSPGIPVVIASGYSQDRVLTSFREAKPTAVLHKPYTSAQLQEVLQRLCVRPSPAGEAGHPES